MERLPKITIYLAIGIGLTIFSLFLFSILPHIIENSSRDWERALGNIMTEEDLKALFYAESAYTVFKEKYPNATESFKSRGQGEGRLYLIMYNYTNLNEIRLEIHYDSYRQNVSTDISCQISIPGNERDMRRTVDGDGAVDFIEKVDCLNFKIPLGISQTDYDNNFNNEPRMGYD